MRRAMAVATMCAAMTVAATAEADTIHVLSTTDTVDAGLVEGLIKPAFDTAYPDDTLSYVAPPGGTGAALDGAKAGQADIVITHAPTSEAQFVADGFTDGPGFQIFSSDYVIVGPKNDPAGVIAKGHDHDAVSAFEDIAAAGEASQGVADDQVPTVGFKSRGNSSGTAVQEQIIWAKTTGVTLQTATAAMGDDTRKEPVDNAAAGKQWYTKTAAGQAANLTQTDVCAGNTDVTQPSGCYTMVDRGTFNRNLNNGTVTKLKIVADDNAASARGGKNLLINAFSAYIVKPSISMTSPKPSAAAVRRFITLLTSVGFQQDLESFPNSVQPAFFPDAFAQVTPDPLPAAVTAGTPVTIAGTVSNRLPGGGNVAGQPVQLQQKVGSGAYANVGSPTTTAAGGTFSLTAMPTQLTSYRVALAAHGAITGSALISGNPTPITYNQFTPSTTDVGTVNATPKASASPSPAPTASPTASPSPSPSPTPTARDRKAPKLSKLRLTRHKLRVRVSEASRLTITITRKGRRTTIRVKTTKARTLSLKHRAIKRGNYRLRIIATDTAGNKRTLSKSVRRR